VATSYPGAISIENIENPRVEAEEHYYRVVHSGLVELGLTPHRLSDTLITSMFDVAERYKHRVDREALLPLVNWRRTANRVRPAEGQPEWSGDELLSPSRSAR
jgi:UDP-sulfoquinovose synthase